MIHSATQVLQQFLIAGNHGTNPRADGASGSWPVYANKLPPKGDSAIVLVDLEEPTQGRIHRTGETIGPSGFQVRVRHKESDEASKKIRELATIFDGVRDQEIVVGEIAYVIQGIHQRIRPVFIGTDENQRPNFTLSGIMTYRRKPNA